MALVLATQLSFLPFSVLTDCVKFCRRNDLTFSFLLFENVKQALNLFYPSWLGDLGANLRGRREGRRESAYVPSLSVLLCTPVMECYLA